MNNDFNHLASAFGQIPQIPSTANPQQQQQLFNQQLYGGRQHLQQLSAQHHSRQPQLQQHYMDAATSEQQQQKLEQMVASQQAELAGYAPQFGEQLLSSAHSQPNAADNFLGVQQLHNRQPQHQIYRTAEHFQQQPQYPIQNFQHQQQNTHHLYLQHQQQLYLQQQQQQQQYLQQQRNLATLLQQPQVQVQAAAQPSVIQPSMFSVPQPSSHASLLQNQGLAAQTSAHVEAVPSTSRIQQHTSSPDLLPADPPHLKAAERAAATAAENSRIIKQREEEVEKERQEHNRRENERIQSETKKHRQNANVFSASMKEKVDNIPEPLHLAACHTLTKVGTLWPLPTECLSTSPMLPVHLPANYQRAGPIDDNLAQYLATVLNECVSELHDIELKHENGERNLEVEEMNSVCRAIHSVNPAALNVESLDDTPFTFDQHVERAVEEVTNTQCSPANSENDPAQAQLRKQIISLGKQPKAAQPRKKKDMVDELYDSLTVYFDPSSRKRRHGDENNGHISEKNIGDEKNESDKKRQRIDIARSPTPEHVIRQRELEWAEKQRVREEKLRRRQYEEANADVWSTAVRAETESITQFNITMEALLDQVESSIGEEQSQLLETLRGEAQKLKSSRKLHKLPADRLSKLMTLLERCVREVLTEDGNLAPLFDTDDDSNDAFRQILDEKYHRAANAACIMLTVMAAPKIQRQVLIEDAIEAAILMCKGFCEEIIFPAYDPSIKNPADKTGKTTKKADAGRKRKGSERTSPTITFLYDCLWDLLGCLADIVRFQTLNEATLNILYSLGTPVFFVDGVEEMQIMGIRLLTTVFATAPDLRRTIIQDLLESLHRLPSTKNRRNSYRLGADQWIGNFSALILQLIQSVLKVPVKKSSTVLEEIDSSQQHDLGAVDAAIIKSYDEARGLAAMFIGGFLGKFSAKSDDELQRSFKQFLEDILIVLHKPTWPVAELILTVMGHVLVKKFRSKCETSLRTSSLEQLGTIAARLRKDRVHGRSDDKTRLDLVVKTLVSYEKSEDVNSVDISHMTTNDKTQFLEQALIDYIIKENVDDSVEYTVRYYVAVWYRETLTDLEAAKQRHEEFVKNGTEAEVRKEERRLQKLLDRGEKMKTAILKLMDRKYLKSRAEYIARTDNVMLDSDATWSVKYLASKREFSQSFEQYLKQITFAVSEQSVNVRTKAMRCLTQIIEVDNRVLLFEDVQKVVNGRLTDPNISVREATADLIGKYVVSRPDLMNQYYGTLVQRIVDTGVAVRKRIIRILRDIVEKQPTFEKNPEILAKIIRRVADEDSVKKMVVETIYNIWFTQTNDDAVMEAKITLMADTVNELMAAEFVDFFKQLVTAILKEYADRPHLSETCRNIIDALVDRILALDQEMATVDAEDANDEVDRKRVVQQRLVASLTALSVFSSVRPQLLIRHAEVFIPYLAIRPTSSTEGLVLVSIIQMLERIIPLMEYPSDTFLHNIDNRMDEFLATQANKLVISAAASCSGTVYKHFPKFCPKLMERFSKFLEYLRMMKGSGAVHDAEVDQKKIPILQKVMFSLGVICRYFDVAAVMERFPDNGIVLRLKEFLNDAPVRKTVLDLLSHFCSMPNAIVRRMSLNALGQLTAECPEFLLDDAVKRVYVDSLKDRRAPILMQSLVNLNLFLVAAEERAQLTNEQFRREREGDLKEMELGNSGLSSSIMQNYWTAVTHSYFHPMKEVRQEASNVIYQTQSQGLLTPGDAIPILVAMCTDPVIPIRSRVEVLIKEIDSKYAGMVSSKAISGVRRSFRFQMVIRQDPTEIIRGIRANEQKPNTVALPTSSNDVQSLLNGLYTCIRANRQQRRSLLQSMLALFSDNVKESISLEERIYLADNLAHFPYQNMDEPLYVIFHANQMISVSGQNILSSFKEIQSSRHVEGADDDEYSPDVIYAQMPDDKTQIYELKKETHSCYLLIALKSFLMRMYNFKEDKVHEYSPSDAAKIYEKPVGRRNISIFSPQSVFDELKRNKNTHNTLEDHINLAKHFSIFFNKLLSLDREVDEDAANATTTITGDNEEEDEE